MRWKKLNSFRVRHLVDSIPPNYLTSTEKKVLSVLARHYPLNFLSEAKIAFYCGVDVRTVKRALKSLETKGYIAITGRPGRTSQKEIHSGPIVRQAKEGDRLLKELEEKAKAEHADRRRRARHKKKARTRMLGGHAATLTCQTRGCPPDRSDVCNTADLSIDGGDQQAPEMRVGSNAISSARALSIAHSEDASKRRPIPGETEYQFESVAGHEFPNVGQSREVQPTPAKALSKPIPPPPATRVFTPLPRPNAPPPPAPVSQDDTVSKCDIIKGGREEVYNTKNFGGTSTCIKCKGTFPADQFPSTQSRPGKPGLWCKRCRPRHLDVEPGSTAKPDERREPALPAGYTIEACPTGWETVSKAPAFYVVYNADQTLTWTGRTRSEAIASALKDRGKLNPYAPKYALKSEPKPEPKPEPKSAPPIDGLPKHITISRIESWPSHPWRIRDSTLNWTVTIVSFENEAEECAREYAVYSEKNAPMTIEKAKQFAQEYVSRPEKEGV